MNDPRIEAAAAAIADLWDDANEYGTHEDMAAAALEAADKSTTPRVFTGAEINTAGWTCGACEPGDYTKCDDCQSAADDVAQFVNRLNGSTP